MDWTLLGVAAITAGATLAGSYLTSRIQNKQTDKEIGAAERRLGVELEAQLNRLKLEWEEQHEDIWVRESAARHNDFVKRVRSALAGVEYVAEDFRNTLIRSVPEDLENSTAEVKVDAAPINAAGIRLLSEVRALMRLASEAPNADTRNQIIGLRNSLGDQANYWKDFISDAVKLADRDAAMQKVRDEWDARYKPIAGLIADINRLLEQPPSTS